MIRFGKSLLAAATVVLMSLPVSAATVSVTGVTGSWFSPTPPDVVGLSGIGTDPELVESTERVAQVRLCRDGIIREQLDDPRVQARLEQAVVEAEFQAGRPRRIEQRPRRVEAAAQGFAHRLAA